MTELIKDHWLALWILGMFCVWPFAAVDCAVNHKRTGNTLLLFVSVVLWPITVVAYWLYYLFDGWRI